MVEEPPEAQPLVVLGTLSPLQERMKRLTGAEQEVAQLLLEGRSAGEIAALRGSSPSTVEGQIEDIYRLYRVSSRTELAWVLEGPDPLPPPGERRAPRQAPPGGDQGGGKDSP